MDSIGRMAALGRIAAAHPLAEVLLAEKGGLNDYRRVYLRRIDAFTVVVEADAFGHFHLGRTHCGLRVSEAVATAVLRAMAEEDDASDETTKETA